MQAFAHYLNAFLTGLFNALLWPLKALDPIWGLLLISLLAGIFMVWIFGRCSNQKAIGRVRDRIGGNLIGVHLFRHDLRVLARLQIQILKDTLIYMKHAIIPLIVMIAPVMLILAQLHLRYASRPLEPGERALVKVKVRDSAALQRGVSLEGGEGVSVETESVRIPSRREMDWRIRADRPGEHVLTVRMAEGGAAEKKIAVGSGDGLPVAVRTGRGFLHTLLFPGEAPLPADSPFESIEVLYPSARLFFFGWGVHWLVAFCALSILFGFACKGILGVRL